MSPFTDVRGLILGVYIDADITMRTHVTNTFSACFSAMRQICSVRQSLPQHTLLTLVQTLVITKLHQCNSVLVRTSRYLQGRLQSVLNAAARLVYSREMSQHTTPLLRELHWYSHSASAQYVKLRIIVQYYCEIYNLTLTHNPNP